MPVSMYDQEDREAVLLEILTFARQESRSPSEHQSLILAGALLVGLDAISSSISDLQQTCETTLSESIGAIGVAVTETMLAKDIDRK